MNNRPLRVYLADLTYTNRLNLHTRHIPKNIGFIASYAKKVFGDDIDISLFKEPTALLDAAAEIPPDVVGMSFYFWNTQLNQTVARILRERNSADFTLVWGGPSVDTDTKEQARLFERFPEVDAFIPNEGELGFAAFLERRLSGKHDPWIEPMDGVVHMCEGAIVRGRDVGLSLDLAELPSPYLNGLLDPFIKGNYLPGIQTSRLCPYTCAFCVSGKTRGKLRGFPIDQVKEELDFVSRSYADRPQMEMHINDENFGILPRDSEIADHIVTCQEKWGFPQNVFFYHDKRLVDTTRKVLTKLAPLSSNGVVIPLQTESPEALKVAKRKGLSQQQLSDVVDWASENDLFTATELIFGLPGETAPSFAQSLDTAIERGFDSVLCNTLFIVDGIELNREEERKRLNIGTRYRQIRENYGMLEGKFCAEVEEVVVSTKSFDVTGFLDVRKISMMFYACFNMRFHYWLMSHFRHLGVPVTHLVRTFLDPDVATAGPWRTFANDFENKAMGELFDSADELRDKLKQSYIDNGNDVGESAQLNILFGSRMIYEETAWIDEALVASANHHLSGMTSEDQQATRFLINLYRLERIDVTSLEVPDPVETHWDILTWREEKFQKPLSAYALDHPKLIEFSLKPAFVRKYNDLRAELGDFYDQDFYNNLLQRIGSRSDLMLQLAYV